MAATRDKVSSPKLNKAAEGIGRSLGHAARRLDLLNKERASLVKDLRAMMAAGQRMLEELAPHGDDAAVAGSTPRTSGARQRAKTAKVAKAPTPPADRAQAHPEWKAQRAAIEHDAEMATRGGTHAPVHVTPLPRRIPMNSRRG